MACKAASYNMLEAHGTKTNVEKDMKIYNEDSSVMRIVE